MWFLRDVVKDIHRLSENRWLLTLCDLHWLLGERNHTQIIIETEDIQSILIESPKHPAYYEFCGFPVIKIQNREYPPLQVLERMGKLEES